MPYSSGQDTTVRVTIKAKHFSIAFLHPPGPDSVTLVFNAVNWHLPQTVVVTGAADFKASENYREFLEFDVDSEDSAFNTGPLSTLSTTDIIKYNANSRINTEVIDDDIPGYEIKSTGIVTEIYEDVDTTGYFDLSLRSQPDKSVVLRLENYLMSSLNVLEPQTITFEFSTTNWNVTRRLTFNINGDAIQMPYSSSLLLFSTVSDDKFFSQSSNLLSPELQKIHLNVEEDDSAG